MKKSKNKGMCEFLITTDCGFQYIITDDLRHLINDGNIKKPIELERWMAQNGKDVVIELRVEQHRKEEK